MNPAVLAAILITTVGVICATIFSVWDERRRWKWLRSRHSHEKLWLRIAPDDLREDLKEFLLGVSQAWLLPESKTFCLKPSDDLHLIYRHVYRFSAGDTLEYEILCDHIESAGFRQDRISASTLRVGDLVREWLAARQGIEDTEQARSTEPLPRREMS